MNVRIRRVLLLIAAAGAAAAAVFALLRLIAPDAIAALAELPPGLLGQLAGDGAEIVVGLAGSLAALAAALLARAVAATPAAARTSAGVRIAALLAAAVVAVATPGGVIAVAGYLFAVGVLGGVVVLAVLLVLRRPAIGIPVIVALAAAGAWVGIALGGFALLGRILGAVAGVAPTALVALAHLGAAAALVAWLILSGTTGESRAPGMTGMAGESRAPGMTGMAGESGMTGPTGESRTTGTTGATGATGTTGTTGENGVTGTTGRSRGGFAVWVRRHRVVLTAAAALCAAPYVIARATWLTPWPLFAPAAEVLQAQPAVRLTGLLLGLGMLAGAVLTSGLVLRWGERFPRWMAGLGGRMVPVAFAVLPAILVAVLFTVGGVEMLVMSWHNQSTVAGAVEMALVLPFWLWGPLLGLATWGYAMHRRGQASCTIGARSSAETQSRVNWV